MSSTHKILKEGSLNKVRSGGWGTNKRWFVLSREIGTSTHSLMYFKNEATRKTNFSQPAGVYLVKLFKVVRSRDKEDPKNVGVSIYFKSSNPTPKKEPSPTKKDEDAKESKEGEIAAESAEKGAEKPAADSTEEGSEQKAGAAKSAEPAGKEAAAPGEKTFMLLEAENKAEADAWIAALVKAHTDEGTISQQVLLQEETGKLRENRAKKEKQAEEAAKIEGELRKLKQSNKIGIGAWQTRFFSLDAEFFSYYKSNKKGDPLGYFPVNQMVCVGTSPLQDNTCFFFRLPAAFSTGDGKYLKHGAPMSPSGAASEGDDEDKKAEAKPIDPKTKDVIILLRCNTTVDRDRWIQAFVDSGVKKAVSKDKPEPKQDEKVNEAAPKADEKPTKADEKPTKSDEKPASEVREMSADSFVFSSESSSSSSSSSPTPTLLPVEDD